MVHRISEATLRAAQRQWVSEEHLRNVHEGEWTALFDERGNQLEGIRGRKGATAIKADETEIGIDYIEMQPGSAFPLHVHDGDHILFIQSGRGAVHINGKDASVKAGDTVFIPAEYPHGVKGPHASDAEPLVLLAFGHPHKALDSHDRMHVVDHE